MMFKKGTILTSRYEKSMLAEHINKIFPNMQLPIKHRALTTRKYLPYIGNPCTAYIQKSTTKERKQVSFIDGIRQIQSQIEE